ncbi:hypothetical protein AB0D57_32090 [Streptomyces sp. NPDC048275]|uniref:hypothetical protein n=1 Tax=Streptomyces sp. NPDC048275 TaxID=3155629 RepID=UPI0033F0F8EF
MIRRVWAADRNGFSFFSDAAGSKCSRTLLPPPSPEPALPATTVPENTGNGKTGSRMARVLAIMQVEPERLRRSREIAELLGDVTLVATYRQLARWTERGMIKRARTGR